MTSLETDDPARIAGSAPDLCASATFGANAALGWPGERNCGTAKPRLDDPDLPLSDLMAHWPQTVPVFLRHAMMCVGGLVTPLHMIRDACPEYRLDEDVVPAGLMAAIDGV